MAQELDRAGEGLDDQLVRLIGVQALVGTGLSQVWTMTARYAGEQPMTAVAWSISSSGTSAMCPSYRRG